MMEVDFKLKRNLLGRRKGKLSEYRKIKAKYRVERREFAI
jgi:hypothetical protein